MNKIIFIFLILMVLVTNNSVSTVNAQIKVEDGITTEEVKKLIDVEMGKNKTLTQEELTNIVLEMKDEKIENLEGNLSKLINTAALFVATLTGVLAILGWILKKSIDEKLSTIEGKESNIQSIETRINTKVEEMNEYYKKMKEFANNIDRTNEKLNENNSLLNETKDNIKDLKTYIGTIEDVTNSVVIVNEFLNNKIKFRATIEKIEHLFKSNLEYSLEDLILFSETLGMNSEIDSLEKLKDYFDYRLTDLKKEEENLWKRFEKDNENNMNGIVIREYGSRDEDTMSLYDEVDNNYGNWMNCLSEIIKIEEFLKMKSSVLN